MRIRPGKRDSMSDPSPRLLLLETSGRVGLVAVAEGAELRAQRRLDETRRHARDLAPAVADLLREQGWKPLDLSAVIVGRGPGSYTGLRVGVMSAKTLAFATGCALLGIDTFAAIARQSPEECARVDVIADAQKDLVYLQSFLRTGTNWRPDSELAIIPFSAWLTCTRGRRLGERLRSGQVAGEAAAGCAVRRGAGVEPQRRKSSCPRPGALPGRRTRRRVRPRTALSACQLGRRAVARAARRRTEHGP